MVKNILIIVGIIQGNPENYNQGTDHLIFKGFNSWKAAYLQLANK